MCSNYRLSLSVQYAVHDDALPSRPQIRRWVSAAWKGAIRADAKRQRDAEARGEATAQVTVRFVDVVEGRDLNRDYRHKDYATNVLSFPYNPPPHLAGDLVLCLPVVLREAAEQTRPAEAHFAHLIVHGMLHLQGYDHEEAADADRMEAREIEILARLGYPDPYSSDNNEAR